MCHIYTFIHICMCVYDTLRRRVEALTFLADLLICLGTYKLEIIRVRTLERKLAYASCDRSCRNGYLVSKYTNLR